MDKDIVLKWRMPEKTECFFGRKKELNQIHALFQQGEKNVFIQGIGGVGKSGLAAQYALLERANYEVIVFANCFSDVCSVIASDVEMPISNMSRRRYDEYNLETEEEYYKRKMQALQQIVNPNILLVIDNYNSDEDENIGELLALDCKKIITTRKDYSSKTKAIVPLGVLDNYEDILKLFTHYYLPMDEQEEACIKEIIIRLGGHTLAVEWIAKYMTEQAVSLAEVVELLRDYAINYSDGSFTLSDIEKVISIVFNIEKMPEMEKEVLRALCFVPYTGIKKEDLVKKLRPGAHATVLKLLRSSWIKQIELDVVTLHPMITETVVNILKPTWENCEYFISKMAEELMDDDTSIDDIDFLLVLSEKAFALLNAENNRCVKLLVAVAHAQSKWYKRYSMAEGMLIHASQLQNEKIEFLKSESDVDSGMSDAKVKDIIANELKDYYGIVQRLGEVYYLEERYDKALASYSKISSVPDINIHCDIAKVYAKACEFRKASEYVMTGIKIKEHKYGENHIPLVENYLLLANISTRSGDKRMAMEWLEQAKKIAKEEMNAEQKSDFYYELAIILKDNEWVAEALEYDQKSFAIRKKLHGEMHILVARSYAAMAVDYYRLGDYESALKCSLREIKIRKSVRKVKVKLYMSVSRLIGLVNINELSIDEQEELKQFTSDFNRIMKETPEESQTMMRQ